MSYNIEQLRAMPIDLLRGIDIKTREEEELVQKILNEKLINSPDLIDMSLPSYMTDNMTVEKERALQAEIDAKKEEARLKLIPQTEVSLDTVIEEKVQSLTSEVTSTKPKKFCQYCDSKGVRHKKDCKRLSVNIKT